MPFQANPDALLPSDKITERKLAEQAAATGSSSKAQEFLDKTTDNDAASKEPKEVWIPGKRDNPATRLLVTKVLGGESSTILK